jgi:hypothetical protein
VKELVKNNQIEFVNAGWSQHDEANPIYEDMIDNMMVGQQFILDTFGKAPRIGWQIDPFGHTNTNARLFYDMGFDAMFFGRLDEKEDLHRQGNKEAEWIQFPSYEDLGSDCKIFHHKMTNSYVDPDGFRFDIMDDQPIFQND